MSAATEFNAWHRMQSGYITTRSVTWEIGWEGSGVMMNIPAGTRFDSSVPWALRWLVSPHHEPWLLAALVHDTMLKEGYPKASAAAEWHTAAKAKAKHDNKRWLVKPALIGIIAFTVR